MAEVEVAEPQPDLVWDDQVRGLLENGRGSSARLSTRATTPRVTIANPIGLILSEMSCDTSPRIRLITTARNKVATPLRRRTRGLELPFPPQSRRLSAVYLF
jgi:hypothetical protein